MAFHRLKFEPSQDSGQKPNDLRDQFFDKKKTDPRLRAFVREAIDNFPDHDWICTSARRYPPNNKSGHNHEILSALDFRSKTWSMNQLIRFFDWCLYWWMDNPDTFDILIEDGRFDLKYKDAEPHIHVEVDKPYWRRI